MSTMSKNYYIIPIFVPMEGCPHKCVFCDQDKITASDNKVDADFVRTTIEDYLKTINRNNATVEVSFFGGTFTGIPIEKQNELLTVAKEYKDRHLIDKIRMSTRPDYISDDILSNLKKFDVDIIELGVQSLDEEVLKKSGRGHSPEDVIAASYLIKKYGFTLGHQIMLGLPYDTFEKDIDTVEKSIEMKPEICRIYPALVIKGTPMEKMYNRGVYKPYSLEEAIHISKIIYKMYVKKNINVIRIGLQPTDNINTNGDVVAGPFHPAFRELMDSSILNDGIIEYSNKIKGDIKIFVNQKTISKLYSDKKKYFNLTKEKLGSRLKGVFINNDIETNEILLQISDQNVKICC